MTDQNLDQIRRQMSETDEKIIRLLELRAELAREVGKIKETSGVDVYDPAREAAMMSNFEKNVQDDILPAGYLKAIYREIISACRELQKPVTVSCLGPAIVYPLGGEIPFRREYDFCLPVDDIPGVR